MRILLALLAIFALALPAQPAIAQRGRDWTQTAVRTPEGGFRIGNPAAPIKLVEYLSLTCPHCAAFAHEGSAALMQNYVRPGRVNVEYRNYYLNGVDVAAAMLSRCAAPRAYFDLTHALLASQAQWTGRVNAVTAAQRAELANLPPLEIARRLIGLLGLDRVGALHGITPQIRQACLTQANLDALERLRTAGDRLGVTGTPTFFVNGRAVHAHDWAELEPQLSAR